MSDVVEAALARVSGWTSASYAPIEGGITNQSWLVEQGAKLVGVDFSTPDLAAKHRAKGFNWPVHHVLLGGGVTMVVVTQGVLQLDPWYSPSVIIPLAGMIFAASMTNISLAIERLAAELENGRNGDHGPGWPDPPQRRNHDVSPLS